MKFEKGNKYSPGGKRGNRGGRPTKQEAAAKEAMLREAFDRLKMGVGKAVSTLVKHLDSSQENISIRAAESIIEFAQKAVELEELEQRIEALETLTQQGGHYR